MGYVLIAGKLKRCVYSKWCTHTQTKTEQVTFLLKCENHILSVGGFQALALFDRSLVGFIFTHTTNNKTHRCLQK